MRDKQTQPTPSPNGISVTSGEIGAHAMHPPGKRRIDINQMAQARGNPNSKPAGGHSGPPLRGGFVIHPPTNTNSSQTSDAGWNEEQVCREPDLSVAVGCKQVDIRRLAGRARDASTRQVQHSHQ